MTLPRVDWFRVLTQLDRAGMRLPAVSARLSIPYNTLVNIRNSNTEPRHQYGQAIVRLWVEVTGEPSGSVPLDEAKAGMSAGKAKL